MQERSGRLATILVVGAAGIAINPHAPRAPAPPLTTAEADALIRDPVQSAVLRSAFVGREIDDILVAVQGEPLRVLDALFDALPIGRTRERTRNSALQQRAHLETWLARGVMPGENLGAGHIRWSKRALGLTGKLGEFVVRYAGRHPAGGHLLRVSLIDASIDPTVGASPAEGFVTSGNVRLSPHVRFSNKAHMRREMALALRAFGSATRLCSARTRRAHTRHTRGLNLRFLPRLLPSGARRKGSLPAAPCVTGMPPPPRIACNAGPALANSLGTPAA